MKQEMSSIQEYIDLSERINKSFGTTDDGVKFYPGSVVVKYQDLINWQTKMNLLESVWRAARDYEDIQGEAWHKLEHSLRQIEGMEIEGYKF